MHDALTEFLNEPNSSFERPESKPSKAEGAVRKLKRLMSDFNMKGANRTTMHRAIQTIWMLEDLYFNTDEMLQSIRGELKDINELLEAGQGDDDGLQIMPEFEHGVSVLGKIEECLFLLEKRRDCIEGFEANHKKQEETIAELRRRNAELEREIHGINHSYFEERKKVVAAEAKADDILQGLIFTVDCFEAAYAEGLHERLVESTDCEYGCGSLFDLLTRRILYGFQRAKVTVDRYNARETT